MNKYKLCSHVWVHVYVCVYMCVHMYAGTRKQKRAFDPLELEIQAVVSCPMWVMFLAPNNFFFKLVGQIVCKIFYKGIYPLRQ